MLGVSMAVAVVARILSIISFGFWFSICDAVFDIGNGGGDLIKWFRSHGGSACDGMSISSFDEVGMGLGLVASDRDMMKGETLLKAPPALVISHQGLKVVPHILKMNVSQYFNPQTYDFVPPTNRLLFPVSSAFLLSVRAN